MLCNPCVGAWKICDAGCTTLEAASCNGPSSELICSVAPLVADAGAFPTA